MSNWIDYYLDVLAGSPSEISSIAVRLTQPSSELVTWVAAERWSGTRDEVTANLKELLAFEAIRNLGYAADELNKARRFHLAFSEKCAGIARTHLFEVSETYPEALFLLRYEDDMGNCSGKKVIRAGRTLREIFDGKQHAQCLDWALLDIFAPFLAEYELGFAVGSLWDEWVDDMSEAVQDLRAQWPRLEFSQDSFYIHGDHCSKRRLASCKTGQPERFFVASKKRLRASLLGAIPAKGFAPGPHL